MSTSNPQADSGPNVRTRGSEERGDTRETKCLMRAHAGKLKISTLVSNEDAERFEAQFFDVLCRRIDGLEKKQPVKKQKHKKHHKATQ